MEGEYPNAEPGGVGGRDERTPRSIRFHDTEWERSENFAALRDLSASEFVRLVVLAAVQIEAPGTGAAGGLAPLIDQTLRYARILATAMRAGVLGSYMVALHPTSREALHRYLEVRRKEKGPDQHLFVITTGQPPRREYADDVFRRLAEQVGLRKPGEKRGPTPHSLRHAFAVRSLESLPHNINPGRHMLAVATYVGHADVMSTYWNLEATPILLRGIAEATEQAYCNGASHD